MINCADGVTVTASSQLAQMALLFQAPNPQDVTMDFPSPLVHKAIAYCQLHSYEATSSNIIYPMASRHIEDNFRQYDVEFVKPMRDNLEELLAVFKVAKAMKIEALFQLMAASIACWFRTRCMDDVKKEWGGNELHDVGQTEVEKKFGWVFNEFEKAKEEL